MELKMGKHKVGTSNCFCPVLNYHGNFWGKEPTESKGEADVFLQPAAAATARGIANRPSYTKNM